MVAWKSSDSAICYRAFWEQKWQLTRKESPGPSLRDEQELGEADGEAQEPLRSDKEAEPHR